MVGIVKYPSNDLRVNSRINVQQESAKPKSSGPSDAELARRLRNTLMGLGMLGASLVGFSSCAEDDLIHPIEEPKQESVESVRDSAKAVPLATNNNVDFLKSVENPFHRCSYISSSLGLESTKYHYSGNSAAVNRYVYPSGAYDEVYSQDVLEARTDSSFYTRGIVVHRAIHDDRIDTGTKFIQKTTNLEDGGISVKTVYLADDGLLNVKKGIPEEKKIYPNSDGSYTVIKTDCDGNVTTRIMSRDEENDRAVIGDTYVEQYSHVVGNRFPSAIVFDATIEDYKDAFNIEVGS